ncbi:pilus assembly protein [Amycolatopsis sp. WQ 127309]|nr:TadE/TadG family type IV pilus assembly protein [Amycolatopsis sp. WQ 127309]UOZ03403.1 pilus assembly protein [Amycolatopsis sp. WQ 127309]
MPARGLTAAAWRRVRCALAGERGAVTAELVIATPLLLLALLAIIQFALWSHATHVAQAAASQALSATRVQAGTVAAGHDAGQRLLDDLARGPLRSPRIEIVRTTTSAAVSVQGEAVAVLPGVHLHVHAETAGEVERFVPDA